MFLLRSDDEPDHIDGIVEDLEDADDRNGFFKELRLSSMEHSWLARRIDKRIEERRADAAHLLEAEIKVRVYVPARQVTVSSRQYCVRNNGLLAVSPTSASLLFGTLGLR
jgi:hypothetical protein